jgi:hypothetical protein
MSTELQEAPMRVVERCAEAVRHHRAGRCEARRPIYRSSVGRWKLYARHLGPLLDALTG